MIILPAIDIKDGNCVRLFKGNFDTVEKVAENPLTTALEFEKSGAKWLHMVDLDGAKDGSPKNRDIFTQIAANTNLKVELGGGVRDMDTIEYYLSNGISRIILGSAAIQNPDFVKEAAKHYGDSLAVGIDALHGKAAAQGWLQTSDMDFLELAKRMEDFGIKYIIFTDISKDGTLSGPNFQQLSDLVATVSCNIIASGGVSTITDIHTLKQLDVYGVICGKSIYKGTLNLRAAIQIAGVQE